ncbi:MAG TPA: hypothetical protein VJM33_07815 [Microthrixaceae bacterium]|nr:hypothetical protein [Microthrixaceae bacterium]
MTDQVIEAVRAVCGDLPEVVEEPAWVGTRWLVRGRTFAHVLEIADGWPPAYARASGLDGATVLMFRSSGDELDVLRHADLPYFAPPWRADEVGLVVGEDLDAEEIGELVTISYTCQAPKILREQVERDRRD